MPVKNTLFYSKFQKGPKTLALLLACGGWRNATRNVTFPAATLTRRAPTLFANGFAGGGGWGRQESRPLLARHSGHRLLLAGERSLGPSSSLLTSLSAAPVG